MADFSKKDIWRVFFILLGITVVEFIIALLPALEGLRTDHKLVVNLTYIILTVFKAGYIISYFMHLKFEKVHLIYSIGLPTLFVIYAIVLILSEGTYWHNKRSTNEMAKVEQHSDHH